MNDNHQNPFEHLSKEGSSGLRKLAGRAEVNPVDQQGQLVMAVLRQLKNMAYPKEKVSLIDREYGIWQISSSSTLDSYQPGSSLYSIQVKLIFEGKKVTGFKCSHGEKHQTVKSGLRATQPT